jgi:hypothetical protein
MDGMQQALNEDVQENVMPYWRDHNSLKGWCSMNYPNTVTNPLLRRKAPTAEEKKQKEEKLFSNTDKPISAPAERLDRPFSSVLHQGGLSAKPASAVVKDIHELKDPQIIDEI